MLSNRNVIELSKRDRVIERVIDSYRNVIESSKCERFIET